ncbi:MAG: elongation factor P, partial [Clostridia bacterium]|nr:elongation factor P [Clostridia bacterium]
VITKIKNVNTGSVVEKTFRPTEKFEEAFIERRKMQYSYVDGTLYYFMDMETFDMLPINADLIEDKMKFVKENDECVILSFKGNVFDIEPPTFVELTVTETEPGFKGDTSTGATKPCTVETGAQIMVPLFIDNGDVIRIDTRTGEYMERA